MRRLFKRIEDMPAELLGAYDMGRYVFPAPPVCTAKWSTLDWINFVTFPDALERLRTVGFVSPLVWRAEKNEHFRFCMARLLLSSRRGEHLKFNWRMTCRAVARERIELSHKVCAVTPWAENFRAIY